MHIRQVAQMAAGLWLYVLAAAERRHGRATRNYYTGHGAVTTRRRETE